ncbi:MAG: histidine ammonia-lyase [Erysipelotrichaceae bacterium]|nr:histidine ammonia-lyase [Erysipelotrichaceae bacterium]
MNKPYEIEEVVIGDHDLDLEGFIAVARYQAKLKVSEEAFERMQRSRDLVKRIAERNEVAYGITTGFGELAKVSVDKEMSDKLSTNLVLSHSVATGDCYKEEVVRGMMLLLCNSLSHGKSGCRPLLVRILVEMLNKGVIPQVPEKGSLGASGDLAPLSHIALLVLGKGKASYKGEILEGKEAMKKAGIDTVDTLVNKEGLALTNGTHAMTSLAALNLYDALNLIDLADLIASISLVSLTGQKSAFDERIHLLRGQQGQIHTARNILRFCEGSQIFSESQGLRVQDAYSLRCIPQVHGACRDAIAYVKEKVGIEMNAVTDNPLLFEEDGSVISGGNFHGEPMALAMDFLGIAVSEIASISERRLERMVNPNLSNGLKPFLSVDPGINSGFMIVQYSAASMVSENKVLAHPACVDSIPSSANQEDFVSMGTTAARKCSWIIQNVFSVLGFELLTACQAIDLRRKEEENHGLSEFQNKLYELVRKEIGFIEGDQEMRIEIEKIEKLIRSKELTAVIDECR